MANEIKIIVGGDVAGLVRASQQSSAALEGMGAAAENAAKDFAQLGPSTQKAAAAVERFKNGLRDPAGQNLTDNLAQGFQSILRPIDELEAELAQLQQAIRRTTDPKELKRLGDAAERLNTQIGNIKVVTFQTSLNKLNQSAAAAAAGLNKIRPGANGATESLINLSRIAQDAPFGFIGIANNINPLLESFQRLKAQTGTTQSAFKALIGSLSGAGGLGLAVGIGTAALTLLGQGFFNGGRSAKKAAEDVSDFKKILEEVSSDVARDASRVTTLFNALTSGTLNIDQRKKALEELKSINKEFFGSLREEEGLVKNLQTAYDKYLENLLDIGRAKAIESQLTKLFDKKLQLELTIDPKFIGSTTAGIQSAIGRLRKELDKLGGEVDLSKLEKEFNFFDKNNKELTRRIELTQQIKKLEEGTAVIRDAGSGAVRNQIKQIDLQIAGLSKLQKDTGEFQIKTDKHNEKEEDALKRRLVALEKIRDATKDLTVFANLQQQIFDLQVKITLRDVAKNGISKEETDLAILGFKKQLEDAFNKEVLSLEAIPKVKFTSVEMAPFSQQELDALANGTKEKLRVALSDIAKGTKGIPIKSDRQVRIELLGLEFVLAEEEAKRAVERLKDTIINGAVESFASVGNSFGELIAGALSGQGIGEALSKAAQGFLGTIGNVLQEVGKQVIATSTLVKALRAVLDKLFLPGGASAGILAGIALVGLGALLKNIKIPAFAGGVNNFSGGLAIVGERGPELVRLPRGSDVIPNHMLAAGGGAMVVNINVRGMVRGRDLAIIGERTDERKRRLG